MEKETICKSLLLTSVMSSTCHTLEEEKFIKLFFFLILFLLSPLPQLTASTKTLGHPLCSLPFPNVEEKGITSAQTQNH